jgi:TetR/AcrR family transcriptional regulator, cholesterol catabolism regulator
LFLFVNFENFFLQKRFQSFYFDYFCAMEEKINKILQQVSELYFKYGIKSVTMDDVARELGMSKKTLYEYFTDKNELVGKFLEFHIQKIRCVFEAEKEDTGNAIDHLLFISKIIFSFLKEMNPSVHYDLQKYYPEIFKSLFEYKRNNMLNSVIQNITRGMKEGVYRKDLKPTIIAHIYVARVEASMDADFLKTNDFTSSELFSEMFTYHIRGISSKKGIEYFEKQICLNNYLIK